VQAFFLSDRERKVILGVPTTGGVKTWLNGQPLHHLPEQERFRPHGHKTQAYLDCVFKPGFNEVLVKWIRPAGAAAFDAHLISVDPEMNNAGIVDLGWTRLPWD
jgi:hypothetical protein